MHNAEFEVEVEDDATGESRVLLGTASGGYEPADPACGILNGQAVAEDITLTDENGREVDLDSLGEYDRRRVEDAAQRALDDAYAEAAYCGAMSHW